MQSQLGIISSLADVIGIVTMTVDYDTPTDTSLAFADHQTVAWSAGAKT